MFCYSKLYGLTQPELIEIDHNLVHKFKIISRNKIKQVNTKLHFYSPAITLNKCSKSILLTRVRIKDTLLKESVTSGNETLASVNL